MVFKKVISRNGRKKVKEALNSYNPDAKLRGQYFVAVKDGKILGVIGVKRISWFMTELKHLYVKEEFRRQGVGRFLIEKALEKANTPLLCCTVQQGNEASMRLFQSHGFEPEKTFNNLRTGNRVVLLMRKKTNPESANAGEGNPDLQLQQTVEAVKSCFANTGFWRKSIEEQSRVFHEAIRRLNAIYGRQVRLVCNIGNSGGYAMTGGGCYNPDTGVITIYKSSLMTFLHEYGHALKGRSEVLARKWSHDIFRKALPVLYRRSAEQGLFFHTVKSV